MEFPRKFLSETLLSWYMDIPFYYGKEDKYGYADWESCIEEFFAYYTLSEEEMYFCAKWRLLGEASRWWKTYGEGCEFWYQMKAEFQHRYLPKRRTVTLKQQDAKLKPEVQSVPAPKPEHDITSEIELKPDPEVEPEHESKSCFEPEPEIETCVEPEPAMEHEPECDIEPLTEPDAAIQLGFAIESFIALSTELQFESSLHIPPQFVEYIDFIIPEPPPLTSQQLLHAFLPCSEMLYPHESIRLRVYISVHFKVRGRVFSNTKTLQSHVSFYHSPGGESFEAEENDRGPEATKLQVLICIRL